MGGEAGQRIVVGWEGDMSKVKWREGVRIGGLRSRSEDSNVKAGLA